MARFRRVYVKGEPVDIDYRTLRQLKGWQFVPEDFACDGCTLSPDSWRGYSWQAACVIHDVAYRMGLYGGTWAGRRRVDADFRQNLRTLLEVQGAPTHLRVTLPWVYWRAVRLAGAAHYAFAAAEVPLGFWQRWREAALLFLSKGPNGHGTG